VVAEEGRGPMYRTAVLGEGQERGSTGPGRRGALIDDGSWGAAENEMDRRNRSFFLVPIISIVLKKILFKRKKKYKKEELEYHVVSRALSRSL
jgi:hypothetical protein